MTEIRKRVAVLPDNTAIIYTAVNLDGAGVAYRPHEALAAIAEVANRPVVIDAETNIGHGGIGGLVSHPALIGRDAARIALRIINGERPSDIPHCGGRCHQAGVRLAAVAALRNQREPCCHRVAISAFVRRPCGSNTAGR